MNLYEKIRRKNKTIYQQVAEKYGTTVDYVGRIARDERKSIRGKALQVKQELERITNE